MAEDNKNTQKVKDLTQKKPTETPSDRAASTPSVLAQGASAHNPSAGNAARTAPQRSSGEEGASADVIPIILVTPYGDAVTKLKQHFTSDPKNRIYEVSSVSAHMFARGMMPCLLIGTIAQNSDVVRYVTLLKQLAKEVRKNTVKFILISKVKNDAIVQAFEANGCHEYIVEPINERSLTYKMDMQTRAIGSQRKQMRTKQEAEKNTVVETKELKLKNLVELESGGQQQQKKKNEEREHDVFVFRGSSKAKKEGKKWTLRVKGPDPSLGEWLEMKEEGSGEAQWRFMEKNASHGAKAKSKNAYAFTGKKPEFLNGEWQFEGEKPKLAIVDEQGKEIEVKLSVDPEGINVGKESKIPSWKVKDHFLDDLDESEAKGPGEKEGHKGGKKTTNNMALAELAMDFDGGTAGGKNRAEAEQFNASNSTARTALNAAENGSSDFNSQLLQRKGEKSQINAHGSKPARTEDSFDGQVDASAKDARLGGKRDDAPDGGKPNESKKTDNKHLAELAMDFDGADRNHGGFAGDLKKKSDPRSKFGELEDVAGIDGKSGRRGREEDQAGASPTASGKKKEEMARAALDGSKESKARNKGAERDDAAEERRQRPGLNFADFAADLDSDDVGSESRAKTEHFSASDWNGHDLTPESKQREARRGGDASSEGGDQKRRRRALDVEALESDSGERADATADSNDLESREDAHLGEAGKNFLQNKKDKERFGLGRGDKEAGGRGTMGSGEARKGGARLRGHDSDVGDEIDDGEDKIIELEGPDGRLGIKDKEEEVFFELPAESFGDPLGTWENTGAADREVDGTKLFVFVPPHIRLERTTTVEHMPIYWTWRGEQRPVYGAAQKVWRFKARKPDAIKSFKQLTVGTQAYLLSISPGASSQKRAEAMEKARAAAEKARQKIQEASRRKTSKDQLAGQEQGDAPQAKGAELDFSDKKKRRLEEGTTTDFTPADGEETDASASVDEGFDSSDFDAPKRGDHDALGEGIQRQKRARGSLFEEGAKEELSPKVGEVTDGDEVPEDSGEQGAFAPDRAKEPGARDSDFDSDRALNAKTSGAVAPRSSAMGAAASGQPIVNAKGAPVATNGHLPASPMLAVVLAEMLISNEQGIDAALAAYFEFLSISFGGANIALFSLKGMHGKVVAGNHAGYPLGYTESFERHPNAMEAITKRIVIEPPGDKGAFFCPVKAPANMVNANDLPIALLIIETTSETDSGLKGRGRYLYGVAQCLRGVAEWLGRRAWSDASAAA